MVQSNKGIPAPHRTEGSGAVSTPSLGILIIVVFALLASGILVWQFGWFKEEVKIPEAITQIVLCEDSIDNFNEIEKILTNVIDKISSLEEFYMWLKSQRCIKSVEMEASIVKTLPPQKEFVVEFKMSDGSITKKAIDIFLLENITPPECGMIEDCDFAPGQKFKFHKLHD